MPKKQQRQSIGQLRAFHLTRQQGYVTSKREQNNLSEIAKQTGLPIATVKLDNREVYEVMPRLRSKCCSALLDARFKRMKIHDPAVNGAKKVKAATRYEYTYLGHYCCKCKKPCETK